MTIIILIYVTTKFITFTHINKIEVFVYDFKITVFLSAYEPIFMRFLLKDRGDHEATYR